MKLTTLTLLTLLSAPALAVAQEADATDLPAMADLVAAYNAGEFEAARAGLAALAETGDPVAQYRLGRIMVEGRGGPQNVRQAAEWLDRSSTQGNADAALMLAQLHLAGAVDPADSERAARLLRQAATRGHAEAQVALAQLLLSDRVASPDPAAAFDWMLAAAEQQSPAAQYGVAQMFDAGRGTTADPTIARLWLERAADNDHGPAQLDLAMMLEREDDAATALGYYERAAEGGVALAQRILGSKFLYADGVEPDRERGIALLEQAASAGEPGAQMNLAVDAYQREDFKTAADLFTRAADAGLLRAQVALGDLYRAGIGVKQDSQRAASEYGRAHDAGYQAGTIRLGQMIAADELRQTLRPAAEADLVLAAAQAGDADALDWLADRSGAGNAAAQARLALTMTEPADAAERLDLLRRSAMAGDAVGQAYLGAALIDGNATETDLVEGYAWLNIAASRGIDLAISRRDTVAQLLSPDDLARGQARSRALLRQIDAAQVPRTSQTVRQSK